LQDWDALCNFRGADLSGADFTGADIRSARFVNTNLEQGLFCQVIGGLPNERIFFYYVAICAISMVMGFFQGYATSWIGIYIAGAWQSNIFAVLNLLFTLSSLLFICAKGVSNSSVIFVCLLVILITSLSLLNSTLRGFSGVSPLNVSVDFAHIIPFFILILSTLVVATIGCHSRFVSLFFVVSGFFTFAFMGSLHVTVQINGSRGIGVFSSNGFQVILSIALLFLSLLLIPSSIHIGRRINQDDSNFRSLRLINLMLTTFGGTTFSGADLTGATFAHAHLKSTNFADSRQRSTTLTHVRWHGAEKLDRARLGTSALQDPRVRTLLPTLNGVEQDLTNADLQGANLAGAKLYNANLKGANLNGTTLERAELQGANLTKAQCIGHRLHRGTPHRSLPRSVEHRQHHSSQGHRLPVRLPARAARCAGQPRTSPPRPRQRLSTR
jgi:uncharacterized protein YjbI with pentapeptide repeats